MNINLSDNDHHCYFPRQKQPSNDCPAFCDTSYGQHLETEAVVHHFVGNVHGSARLHESDCQWQGQEVFPKYLRNLRRHLKHVVIFESMTSTCNAAALQVECIKSSIVESYSTWVSAFSTNLWSSAGVAQRLHVLRQNPSLHAEGFC